MERFGFRGHNLLSYSDVKRIEIYRKPGNPLLLGIQVKGDGKNWGFGGLENSEGFLENIKKLCPQATVVEFARIPPMARRQILIVPISIAMTILSMHSLFSALHEFQKSRTIAFPEYSNWVDYKSDAGGFSARFPDRPETNSKRIGSTQYYVFQSGGHGTKPIVGVTVLKYDFLIPMTPEEALEKTQQELVRQLHATLINSTKLMVGSSPAKEILMAQGNIMVRTKLILSGLQDLYRLTVIAPKDEALGKAANSFFDSFQITKSDKD
jgi:hypothetical protein